MKWSFFLLIALISITTTAQVQLKFVTVNQYGNNLYIDNVTLGKQMAYDAAVISFTNIEKDTSYTIGSAVITLAPKVLVMNTGLNPINTPFNVTLSVLPGTYQSVKQITSLAPGQSTEVVFDNLSITPGQPVNLTATCSLAGDLNPSNDQLQQYSIIFPGVLRNVLLEEWTSSTCGPCAANNPTVDAFIESKFDSLVAIKYHMNWPSPGNDPMYLYNPEQANDRRFYYGISAVPHIIMDGKIHPVYPYTTAGSLPNAFATARKNGSPVSITVNQNRLTGDTIHARVTLNILAPLRSGDYYLRVHAIERVIRYASAPGTNGETTFYDVFRKAYPNSLGTPIPLTPGTYEFNFKYKLDLPTWVDTSIYTAVFIQNDRTKEVLNAGKYRLHTDNYVVVPISKGEPAKPVPSPDVLENSPKEFGNKHGITEGVFYYSLFEESFPSPGWKVINPDGGITFEQYTGANGPVFGGNNSVRLNFYDYSTQNRADTMYSRIFGGLLGTDSVKFDYAYALYSASYPDRLIVQLSVDGGLSFPYTIFDKQGSALATAGTTTSSFVPTSPSQWRTFSYALDMLPVPVELVSFTGYSHSGNVTLNWKTATETNNYGFEVQRKTQTGFVTVGFVRGHGTSSLVNQYEFTELDVPSGKQIYRLRQSDFSGAYEFSKTVEVDVKSELSFELQQNYPNPFNPMTKFGFSLPEESIVSIKLYNTLGEELTTIVNETLPAGHHSAVVNAVNLNSGIYIYHLEATGISGKKYSNSRTMVVLK